MGLAALLPIAILLAPASAQAASITIETEVYEWSDSDTGQLQKYESVDASDNNISKVGPGRTVLASYGPFHVVDHDKVELAGSIETGTPAEFQAMLKAWPHIKQIVMVDCPGTGDDEANFALARMIRKAGISTHVPDGGFVASGGVELFLAGVKRSAAPTAEFAVHSWRDSDGMEPDDFAANDPVNMAYVQYYREIGMDAAKAQAFYNMTNSVGHDDALYLGARDIAAYIPLG